MARVERISQEIRQQMSVAERHQLTIARRTLKMTDAMVAAMGCMTKAEAREVIQRLTAGK